MSGKLRSVEINGWIVEVEVLDVAQRPHWEIRCSITRSKERAPHETRGHRFYVPPEVAEARQLDRLSRKNRYALLGSAARRIILRELDAIFSEPEGGLESLRPIGAEDLDGA